MGVTVKVWDKRGDYMDAHCEVIDESAGTWHVQVWSGSTLRGDFPVTAPPGTTTLEAAIHAELGARGIHAQNNPAPRAGSEG